MDPTPTPLQSPTETYKIAVLAHPGSGKTSLIIRFIQNKFLPAYDPTLQDVYTKHLTLPPSNTVISLEFFDHVPSEEARVDTFFENYVANCDGVIIVQDMTGELEGLTYWMGVVERLKGRVEGEGWCLSDGGGFPMVVLGTKGDVAVEGRREGRKKVRGVVEQLGLGFWECSAREGWGVQEGVMGLVGMMRSVREEERERKRRGDERRDTDS